MTGSLALYYGNRASIQQVPEHYFQANDNTGVA